MAKDLSTPAELEVTLGEQIRAARLLRNLSQEALARDAGVSRTAVRNLEGGKGATVETLVRVLKAMERTDWISMLQPTVTISPLQMLKSISPRQRARASREQD
ncbi:helix-turn-helix transcriptional regulator [Rhodoferax sp. BAB1]|uniref:helix-turn-helix transcriptional regulator n=1 Tax=Rhodoferax sp. BAB1 TaxID=2741720 RepID=UPI0015775C37|nr:helix-turn-helix transcriptional regulator [Rhodoferax sp. BAB1]QKO20912.1 helix-turn-helix transcriptional regulator [Rhodoferax sp. BAB1]